MLNDALQSSVLQQRSWSRDIRKVQVITIGPRERNLFMLSTDENPRVVYHGEEVSEEDSHWSGYSRKLYGEK